MIARSWGGRLVAAVIVCCAWSCGPGSGSPDERDELGSQAAALGNFTGYALPWPVWQTGYVVRRDGTGHVGQVDFDIPGPVAAAKAGKVVFVKESSSSGCGSISCWQQANLVVIKAGPQEFNWYFHLAHASVPVQVGTWVSAGTVIGMEGATGYATGPHLHFMASTGHDPWTDPNNPNAAPWATGITPVDFVESTWANLSGYKSSRNGRDISVTSQSPGTIDVYAQGQDLALYRRQFTNGVGGGWEWMDGVLTSAPDADSWGADHREVIVRGLTNEVWTRRWSPLSGWSGFTSLGTPDGSTTSDPSVTALGSGVLELFVRGDTKQLWRRRYNSNGWMQWSNLGAPLGTTVQGGPDAMSWGSGHSDVFVRGTDGQLWHRFRLAGLFSDWDPMGQPPSGISSDPAAVCQGQNACHLFVRGGDFKLWARDFNGAWGGWYSLDAPLSSVLTSGPDTASWGLGHAEVWVRGFTGNLFRRVLTNGSWGAWQDMGATP